MSYYESFVERVIELIKKADKRNSYWINKVKDQPHTYSVDKLDGYCSEKVQYGEQFLKDFVNDFKNHLTKNTQFKIVYKNYFPNSLIMGISEYLFNSYFHDDYLPRKDLNPTLEEFSRTLKCFENIIPTTFLLSLDVPTNMKNINPNYFIKEIFSLNNKNYLSKLKEEEFHEIVSGELDQLIHKFSYEKDPIIKESLIIYLTNRENILEKYPNVQFNILEQIKAIAHPEYWSEIAEYLPAISKKTFKKEEELFELIPKPTYAFELNKNYIIATSSTIFNNNDFSKVIQLIIESINLHKPNNIDFIDSSEINGKFKVFVSGEGLEQTKVYKIGKLFESMINEYNSDKVIKYGNYSIKIDTIGEKNKEYLNKAAEKYWLDLELDSTNINKRKNKI